MTIQIYNCETMTIRSEMVRRDKPDGTFYGLRLHMNTDQAVTFWARSTDGLSKIITQMAATISETPSSIQAPPGQFSPTLQGEHHG